MKQAQILVIDDDEQITDILSLSLQSEGYEVLCTSIPEHAVRLVREHQVDLILLDLRLGETNGLELLPKLREYAPWVPIFMITAHGDVESAVSAFNLGASGYIRKPFQEGGLKQQIAHAIDQYRLKTEVYESAEAVSNEDVRKIVRSRDPAMDPVLKRIATAAQVSSNVVISGESGTGKELIARALHQISPRRNAPFVAINCGALPETLLESELFGYVRGAFTDARENKQGLFARADRGTLFLDEIGDAPVSIQTKLLRVLQEREILPVGATQPIKVDVRIIAATHRSLQDEVARGRFRQDLFYRLHVIPIHAPALRDRPQDILYLASLFASRLSQKLGKPFAGFTPHAEKSLQLHSWPGNVRELENRVEQALALSDQKGYLTAKSLFPDLIDDNEAEPAESDKLSSNVPTFFEAKISFEKSYLEKVLLVARGNISRAAKLASKSRTEVYTLIRKHGLAAGNFKK